MRESDELTDPDLIDPDRLPTHRRLVPADVCEQVEDTDLLPMAHVVMEEPDTAGAPPHVRELSELTQIDDRITMRGPATRIAEHVVDSPMNPLVFHVNHLDSPWQPLMAGLPAAPDVHTIQPAQ